MNWMDDYFQGLSQGLGLAIELGADGTASLDMGQGVVVHLEVGSEHLLHCYAVLGTAASGEVGALYERLLSAQFFGAQTGAAMFAFDAQRRELLLMQRIDVRHQADGSPSAALRDFAALARTWTLEVSAFSKQARPPATETAEIGAGWLAG